MFHSYTPLCLRKEAMELQNEKVVSEAGARTNGSWTAVRMGATAGIVAATPARLESQVTTPRAAEWEAKPLTHSDAHRIIWDT